MNPIFRPSASHRWINCPGAAWVAKLRPNGVQSKYASKGTAEHAILAAALTGGPVESFLEDKSLDVLELVSLEEAEAIGQLAEEIEGLADLEGGEIFVEEKVSIDIKGHVIKGTADVVIVSDDVVFVIDYKSGAGRRVVVERNPQLSLYLLGALQRWARPRVEIGVLQPNGVGEGLTTWIPPTEYLYDFKATLEAAVERACREPVAYTPGPWCWGCVGAELGMCPAILEAALRVAVEATQPQAQDMALPPAEPAWWVLDHADALRQLTSKIEGQAYADLHAGKAVPGWRIGHKRGRRRWKVVDEMPDVLAGLSNTERDEWVTLGKPRVIGITEALRDTRLRLMARDIESQYIETTRPETLEHDDTNWLPWEDEGGAEGEE